MNAKQNVKTVSSFEEQLNSVQISQYERNVALHQARIAELFVDAIVWVTSKAHPKADVLANLEY